MRAFLSNRLDLSGQKASLAKNAAFLFGLRALQRLLGLAALYFVVRALTTPQFGEYQFILSCVALLGMFALPGLNNSIMQSIARGFYGGYRRSVYFSLGSSLLGSLILLGFALYYHAHHRDELGSGFLIASALFPLAYGLEQWRSVKSGAEDFAAIFRLDGIGAAVLALLMIVAVKLRPGDLLVPLTVLLAVQAALNTLLTWTTFRRLPAAAPLENGAISYGIKLTAYSAFNILANQIDKVLLFFFLSPASVALFFAAERIPELTKGAVQDVAAVLAPRFAKRSRYTHDLDRMLRLAGLATGAGIAVIAFTVLPWILILLFGESYRSSVPYAQALMCSIAIGNVSTLRYRYITSKLDAAGPRTVTILMSVTRIAASLILVPLFGLVGAVVSAFVYRIAMTIIVHVVIRKRYLDNGASVT
jgi:O-antigen/teichoic acid export membrane protein